MMPVSGSACSQKNMNVRLDRSSRNASSFRVSVARAFAAGGAVGATTCHAIRARTAAENGFSR